MKNIILFDMDGTLTEPRQTIEDPMINQLMEVLRLGHDVGVVTGSPEKYVFEQIGSFIERYQDTSKGTNVNSRLHIMPCNGTQYSYYVGKYRNEIVPENMIDELGENNFYDLTAALVSLQAEVLGQLKLNNLALTGDFIQYRGSMINWSPIGRNANTLQRKEFVKYDLRTNFRNVYKSVLEGWLVHKKMQDQITVALGGSTSFDVYPKGWDKTYAMSWFAAPLAGKEYQCWFIGDKCQPGGNDYHLYELLEPHGRGFETKNPEETIEIVKNILSILSPDSSAG